MRILDAPVRIAAGRTPRELALIAVGLGSIAHAVEVGDRSWDIYVYVIVTALFAIRFFAARVLFLSMCVGSLALQLSHLLQPGTAFAPRAGLLVLILGLSLALCGADLLRRFDDGGRGLGPLRNFWQDMSVGQRRHLAWAMHLLGALGGLFHHMAYRRELFHQAVPAWLYVAIAACFVVGILYLAGRAIAAPLALIIGVVTTVHLAGADAAVTSRYGVMAQATAVALAVMAAPWAWRWLRLARGPG